MTTSTRSAAAARTVRTSPRFEDFYVRDRAGLHRALSFALGDPQLAGEAVDEAMTRAYQRWDRISRYDDPAGWVYRVGLNWGRSAWRRAGRVRPGPVPDDARAGAELPDPELWAAVARLPEGQRDAIVLRFVLDWPHERIARALGITASSARSRVTRALQQLRSDLEGPS